MVCKIVFLKLIKLLDTIRLKHLITALFKFNYVVLSPVAISDLFMNIISTQEHSTPGFLSLTWHLFFLMGGGRGWQKTLFHIRFVNSVIGFVLEKKQRQDNVFSLSLNRC